MPDSFEDQEWVKMGVASTLSKEYEKDQRLFLEVLAKTLTDTIPDQTELEYQGFFKKKLVKIKIQLGEDRLALEDTGKGPIIATKSHIVRGIALKNEQIGVDVALADLSEAIEQRAAQNTKVRDALAKTLGLD